MKRLSTLPLCIILCAVLMSFGFADSCTGGSSDTDQTPAAEAGESQNPGSTDQAHPEKKGEMPIRERVQTIPRFWKDAEIAEALNLSDEQKQALDSATSKYVENLISSRRKMRVSYQKMLVALNQDPVKQEIVETAEKAFREAGADRFRVMTSRLVEFRSILTQEQWKELFRIRPRAFEIDRFRPAPSGNTARQMITNQEPDQGVSPGDPSDNADDGPTE